MHFGKTGLQGAYLIEPVPMKDERGFFSRSFCKDEFRAHGLNPEIAQCNISYNHLKGTLRGMHFQEPRPEAKLVRCTRGAIWDVIVDLRADSPTYLSNFGARLDSENRLMLYVPEGFAHGFLTLEDNVEVFYQMSEFYVPGNSGGVRWNDPAFGIAWPGAPASISDRDRDYPDYLP